MANTNNEQSVLVLAAELPVVSGQHVRELLQVAPGGDSAVVVAPDRKRENSNPLLVRPPGLLKYQLQHDRVVAHMTQAQQRGTNVLIMERRGLQLDLDGSEDIAKLRLEFSGRILPN